MKIKIRNAKQNDLAVINDIYNYYVLNSTCTFQTEPETFEGRNKWFNEHNEEYPIIVAENNRIIGWASISKYQKRQAYKPTVENSIYIRNDKLGNGVGTILITEIIRLAKDIGYHSIVAVISGDQELSIHFHERHGFKKVAHLKEAGYKFNKWLDVVYYQLLL